MPNITHVTLHSIGDSTNPSNSVIKLTYGVSFDSIDQFVKIPYFARAYVIGDDTNVPGDAAPVDDQLYNSNLGIVYPSAQTQNITTTFEVPDVKLNEDNSSEPANSNPDEIRVRVELTPFQGYTVMSSESFLLTLSLP